MANGSAFEHAAQMAKTVPNLSVGCHIVLLDGEPVLTAQNIRTLVSHVSGSARFRDGLKSFAALALTGRLDPDEIEAEASAQIRKVQSAGISVSHFDTHKHTHVFPAVLRPLLRAAAACGVRSVRNPFGSRRPLRSHELFARPGLWTRYAEFRILGGFASKFRTAADRQGFVPPDGTLGIVVTGALDERLFRALAENITEGTWEFVCHPGYNDEDLRTARTRLRDSRETELAVLTRPAARQLLSQGGIKLISYQDLRPR